MKKILRFLSALSQNNNREWFEVNKAVYKELQAEFNVFTEHLIEGIASFDTSVQGLTPKDCTYRIYRDVRFSRNKEPYKTHMAAYVCKGGKKSAYAGYYFHLEPQDNDLLGGSVLAAGLYCPEPPLLKSVRDEIFDNGDAFVKSMAVAKGFTLDETNKLKNLPKGFPESKYAEYLKLKDFTIMQRVSDDFVCQKDLVENCVAAFKKTMKFNQILNDAVDFVYEEQSTK